MIVVQILYSGLGGHSSVGFSILEGDQDKKYKHILIFYGIEDMPLSSVNKCEQMIGAYLLYHKKLKCVCIFYPDLLQV